MSEAPSVGPAHWEPALPQAQAATAQMSDSPSTSRVRDPTVNASTPTRAGRTRNHPWSRRRRTRCGDRNVPRSVLEEPHPLREGFGEVRLRHDPEHLGDFTGRPGDQRGRHDHRDRCPRPL